MRVDVMPAPAAIAGRPPTGLAAGRRSGAAGAMLPSRLLPRLLRGRLSGLIPSVAGIVFLIGLLGAVATGTRMLSADGDPGRHLAVGEHILRTRTIPHIDHFSHTMAGTPFVPYEWLAEAASAFSYRLAGLAGPVLLHGAVIGLTFALLFRQLRQRGHALLLALPVTLLAMVTSGIHWLARPHVFTFLGTAVFSAVLDGWHAGRLSARWLWALPVAMVIWANLHGGFLVAFLLFGAYAGADVLRWLGGGRAAAAAAGRLRALLLPVLATLAATLVNPAGPGLLTHVTGYFGKRLLVDITQEYMSPDFHDRSLWFFAGMLLATAAAMAWSRRRPALHEGILFLGFAFVALHSVRNVPLFAIVVAPALAAQLAALHLPPEADAGVQRLFGALRSFFQRRERRYAGVDARTRAWPIPALALAGLLLLAARQHAAGITPLGAEFDPQRLPVGAAAYVKAHPPAGNMFNEFGWGGYLLHELWPAHPVFIDGQSDFYGEPLTREYIRVQALASGWQDVLDRYDVGWVIAPTNSLLVRGLRATPDWQVAYADKFATVVLRNLGGQP